MKNPIAHLSPCSDAASWIEKQTNAKQAWSDCQRGDWMLWLLGKLSGPPDSASRRKLAGAAYKCVELSIPYLAKNRVEPTRRLLAAVRQYAAGEINAKQVRVERNAAAAAYASDAAAAAAAAAYASDADAAYAAYATSATAADADYARTKILSQCADIVRKHYPSPPTIKKNL